MGKYIISIEADRDIESEEITTLFNSTLTACGIKSKAKVVEEKKDFKIIEMIQDKKEMRKENIVILFKLMGIVLCFMTIMVLSLYRGLNFLQGFMLKTTFVFCLGIFLADIVYYIRNKNKK